MQDLSRSWCIKETDESMTRVDSSVPLMHHDPDRSWITDPDPDHPNGTHPKCLPVFDVVMISEEGGTFRQSNKLFAS